MIICWGLYWDPCNKENYNATMILGASNRHEHDVGNYFSLYGLAVAGVPATLARMSRTGCTGTGAV